MLSWLCDRAQRTGSAVGRNMRSALRRFVSTTRRSGPPRRYTRSDRRGAMRLRLLRPAGCCVQIASPGPNRGGPTLSIGREGAGRDGLADAVVDCDGVGDVSFMADHPRMQHCEHRVVQFSADTVAVFCRSSIKMSICRSRAAHPRVNEPAVVPRPSRPEKKS